MMRHVLVYVTGVSSLIGGHVVRELRAAGHNVGDEWIDLLDRERLRQAISGCDAVFHLAAAARGSLAICFVVRASPTPRANFR
jgi:nucleoside-diphosphate-sugar epimerase